MENIRIGIFGPPHSGKSVLLNYLYTHLPQDCTAIVRTAPDGEGMFSNNPNQIEVQLVRKKGTFTSEKNKANIDNINYEVANIVLIDTGGKLSSEKENIFNSCTHAIILSENEKDRKIWENVCIDHKLDIIASLDSSLEGKDEIYNTDENDTTIRGKTVNMTRGIEKETTPLLNSIIEKILLLAKEKAPNKQLTRKGEELLEDYGVIDMLKVANELHMKKNENGNVLWNQNRLFEIVEKVKEKLAGKNKAKFFDARANWLVGSTTEVSKKMQIEEISYYDARKNNFNRIKKAETNVIQKSTKLNGNSFLYDVLPDNKLKLVIKQTDKNVLMHFDINPDIKVLPEDMNYMQLPDIDLNKTLHISGKLPAWLLSHITLSYDNPDKYVLQPGNGFFKYASQNEKQLGENKKEIDDLDLESVINSYKEYNSEKIK